MCNVQLTSLVELERPAAFHENTYFPPHQMRPGDTVELLDHTPKKEPQERGERGVVFRVSDTSITVVIDEAGGKGEDSRLELDLPNSIRLVKLANETTYDRMEQALGMLEEAAETPTPIIDCLLGRVPPTWNDGACEEPRFFSDSLNNSQKDAIAFAMRAQHLALIHGPPGTGKTTALAELVVQLAMQGKSILVCGASNLAVDNLLERVVGTPTYRDLLQRAGAGATRIGHPARVLQRLAGATLDAQCAYSSEGALVRDVAREIDELMAVLSPPKTPRAGNKSSRTAPRPKGAERRSMWEHVRELRREYRKREKALSGTILQRTRVVFLTCHGAGSRQLEGHGFDYVIIDEVCQALEATCWIPILKLVPGGRIILAGDHLQLPPTVKADPQVPDAVAKAESLTLAPPATLETTLFDRILHMYGERCKALLSVQYRMNDEIMAFPNEQLYEGKLQAHESCAGVRLADIEGYDKDEEEAWGVPLVFFDTTGAGMYEREGDPDDTSGTLMQSQSRSNENEADIIGKHIEALVAHGLPVTRIAVLSPYASQVALLSSQLHAVYGHELEIGTVDGMQGREKDAIVLSLVRSNDAHEIGFLQDRRRLNVAMTRAKRHLAIVGDADTVSGGRDSSTGRLFLRAWVDHLHSNALVEMGYD